MESAWTQRKIILYLLARHGGHAPRQQLLYEWLVATEDIPISRRTEYVRKMTFDKTIRLLRRRRFITSQTLCVENPYERSEVDYVLTPIGKQAVPRAANVALEVALRPSSLHPTPEKVSKTPNVNNVQRNS